MTVFATGIRDPHKALLASILEQALHDLSSNDETARFEAFEFFLQDKGPWFESRRVYFDALGLSDSTVRRALGDRLNDVPERPERKWTAANILDILPQTPFKASDIRQLIQLRYSQVASRLQHLKADGHIVAIEHGLFIRAERHDAWLASVIEGAE